MRQRYRNARSRLRKSGSDREIRSSNNVSEWNCVIINNLRIRAKLKINNKTKEENIKEKIKI